MAYLLVAGAIKICCPGPQKRKIVVHIVAPGRFFAGRWLVDRPGRQRCTAVVHVPSVIAMVSGRTVDDVFRRMPASRVLHFMTRRCQVLSRALVRKSLLLTLPLRDRLLCELAALGHEFGEPRENGTLIRLPMTHADLAELVGATRPSVTRCLGELRTEGRVRVSDELGSPGMLLVAA
jgi:CRP/FNR family transcriptional regulator